MKLLARRQSPVLLAILLTCYNAEALFCPDPCRCIEDMSSAQLEVVCDGGGINEQAFQDIISKASKRMTVLKVIGPRGRANSFSVTKEFKKFTKLQEIHLVNSGIQSLGQGVFASVKSLRTLNLAQNELTFVFHKTFENTGHLEHLVLDDNLLKQLPVGAFSYLTELKSLSLARNNLKIMTNFFSGLDNLNTIILDGNLLPGKQLGSLLKSLPSLERLEINGCQTGELQTDSLAAAPQLRQLGLSNNNYVRVPKGALRPLQKLTHLNLAHNTIRSIFRNTFLGVPLTSIDLSHNRLGDYYTANASTNYGGLHPLAFNSTQLVHIKLSYNGYKDFRPAVLGVANSTVRILELSGNPLEQIVEAHTRGLELKALHLADIRLTEVPDKLPASFRNLKLLNLSGNAIDQLPLEATKQLTPSLRILDISRCKFSRIPRRVYNLLVSKLTTFYAFRNPWECDCRIRNLIEYFKRPEQKERCEQLKLSEVKCAGPLKRARQRLVSLQTLDDCPVLFSSSSGLTQQSEMGILIATCVAVVILVALGLLMSCWRKTWKRAGSYRTREDSMGHLSPCSSSDHSDSPPPASSLEPPHSAKERLF